jgi:tight adherence protein B
MAQETLFAVMIFIVVLLMSQAFVAPMMGARRAARNRLRERINSLASTSEGSAHASLVRQKYLQRLSPLQRRLESLPQMERVASLLSQAGLEYPAHRVVAIALGLSVAAGLIAFLRTESWIFALIALLLGASLPFIYLQRRRGQRLRKFEEQLPDALSVVARSLKAGLPFSESIKMVATEMEAPVSQEFGRVFAELNYGGNVRSALFGLLERVPSIAVMAVVTAVLIERETGGNMADVLERIAGLIRQRFRFQRSVRTMTSEGRGTAWVVAVAPFGLAAALESSRPGWISDLVADPFGHDLFIAAFCLMVVGILWLRRLVNIDV